MDILKKTSGTVKDTAKNVAKFNVHGPSVAEYAEATIWFGANEDASITLGYNFRFQAIPTIFISYAVCHAPDGGSEPPSS